MNHITSSQILKCAAIVLVAILAIATILCFYDLGYKNGIKDANCAIELEVLSYSGERVVDVQIYTISPKDNLGLLTGSEFVRRNNITSYNLGIHSNPGP